MFLLSTCCTNRSDQALQIINPLTLMISIRSFVPRHHGEEATETAPMPCAPKIDIHRVIIVLSFDPPQYLPHMLCYF